MTHTKKDKSTPCSWKSGKRNGIEESELETFRTTEFSGELREKESRRVCA